MNYRGTIGSLYGALGHLISRGEYSGVSASGVKGVNGGDENIFLGTIGVSMVSVSHVLEVSVDSFWFKK